MEDSQQWHHIPALTIVLSTTIHYLFTFTPDELIVLTN